VRSAGWALIYDGRAQDLAATFRSNNSTETALAANPAQVELYAENLVRGYRLDVNDLTGGIWRSLCRRTVSYYPVVNRPSLENVGGHPPVSGHLRRCHAYACPVRAFVRPPTVIATATMIIMYSEEDCAVLPSGAMPTGARILNPSALEPK
jgi:hypothetical protein